MSSHRMLVITSSAALATLLSLALPTSSADVPSGAPTFTHPLVITSKYRPFKPGAVNTYRGKEDGDRVVVVVVHEPITRAFVWNGGSVETHLLREVEYSDGKLSQIEYDYIAEADDGTLYCFGEVVDEYENEQVVGHDGSWLIGGPTLATDPVDAATAQNPTVLMPSNPAIGDVFKPEDLLPVADETDNVLAAGLSVKVEAGKFHDVVKIQETSSLESGTGAKWYAPGVGIVKIKGKAEALELIASSFVSKHE